MEDTMEVEEDMCNFSIASFVNCSQEGEDELMDTTDMTSLAAIVVPVTLSIVLIGGVPANISLLCYIFCKKTRKTRHIILIASLAISDLLMLLIGMPFVSTIYSFDDWPYGEFICKLSEFAQTVSASAEVLNLTALSVDRYFLMTTMKPGPSQKTPSVILSCIWIFSILFALPDLISSRLFTVGSLHFCIVYPDSFGHLYREFHVILKLVVLLIIPVLIIATFYILIAVKLCSHKELTPATNAMNLLCKERLENDEKKNFHKRKNLTFVVLMLVVVFVVTWLPRYVYLMWFHFDSSDFNEEWYIFKIVSFCIMFTSSFFNPYIYLVLDRSFRRCLGKICQCFKSRNSPGADDNSLETHKSPEQLTMSIVVNNCELQAQSFESGYKTN